MFLTIFISNIIAWVVLEAIFSFPPCSWVFLFIQDLHFKIHVQSKQGEMVFFFYIISSTCGSWYPSQPPRCSPILDQNILGSHNRGREVHPGLHFTPQYVG